MLLRTTCSRILNTKPSSGVSLKPPLLALVRGVLIARVMTTSSGFWAVLLEMRGQPRECESEVKGLGKKWGNEWKGAYICSSGVLLPGVMWERTLERRWVAIVEDCVCCVGMGGMVRSSKARRYMITKEYCR